MTKEELAQAEKVKKEAFLLEIEEKVKGLIADSNNEAVTVKDLDDKIADINNTIAEKLDNDQMASLKTSIDTLVAATGKNTLELKELKEGKITGGEKPKTFREALEATFTDPKYGLCSEKNDDYGKRLSITDYFNEKGNKETPIMKVAVDFLESNIVQAEVANIRLTELDPQRVGIPLTIYPHVTTWIPSKGITRPYMSVLIVYSYEDGAGTKTEGSASSQSSFLLKTVQFPSFYIATYGTLSDETMDDLPEVLDEISTVFPSKINDNIDGQILGTSGDDSTAIGGLFSNSVSPVKHTDFDTTTYTNTVASGGNMVDLIGTMQLQAETAKYLPNVVIMNPADVKKLTEQRDANDNSILDRRVKYDAIGRASMVSGMKIIVSTSITADTMAVLDINQLKIGRRKDMTIQIGYNAADLTEGQRTVVVKTRLAFAVRDKAGVVYSDSIAADIDIVVNSGQ